MIKVVAEGTGLRECVLEQIFEYVNNLGDLPPVLVASSNRGLAVPDNHIEYISFDFSKTPEQIAEAIGAGETTCRGIREVLEKGASVWVIAGPNGFTVGGKQKRVGEMDRAGIEAKRSQINQLQAKAITDAACQQAVELFSRDGLNTESLTFYFVLVRADGAATVAGVGNYHLKHNAGYTSLLGVISNRGDLMQWAVLNGGGPEAKDIMSELTAELAHRLSPDKMYIPM
jgi:hypothetical protein